MARRVLVSDARHYAVRTVDDARARADDAVQGWGLRDAVRFGLPEIDDRYHVWRVPVVSCASAATAGEVVLDARSGALDPARTTAPDTLRARLDQQGKKIDNWQFLALTHGCRAGKELLFTDTAKTFRNWISRLTTRSAR